MPRSIEFRKQILARIRKRPGRHRLFYLAAAAAVLLGLLIGLPWQQQADGKILFDKSVMARAEENHVQSEMVAYLENTERLLVFIRDNELACSEESRDMAPEKQLAKSLLYQQQHFAPEMGLPRYVQARELFAQLENILVDVNNLDNCTDPNEIEFINNQISKKRILSKLRLIAQDIRLS
jgi:predicted nucleic acid-binding protein